MINRPPTPMDVFIDYFYDEDNPGQWTEDVPAAWEAAFAEWLIEQGLMPDPTDDFDAFTEDCWECEDMTQ